MAPTSNRIPENHAGLLFVLVGLAALLCGVLFGTIAGFQFLYPEFLEQLPFYKVRPLHVSLVVAWIFLAAVGGIYYYLPNHCGLKLFSPAAVRWHVWIVMVTGAAILASYALGKFGGREYWEFPALLGLPIFVSWVIFAVNFFRTLRARREPWPVYFWMWGTGIIFFLITFSEAYLWLIPYFRESMVRELSAQWKAYGGLVGSWNMLVYGTAIFVAVKVSGDKALAVSKMAFGLYFLGLTNLIFGWAHHIYLVPSAPWIRHLSYVVSMTELFVLGKIIWDWRASLTAYRKHRFNLAYRFLSAADVWIFINLVLAIAISIPALNVYTHGTHVTVAHSMGSTIGINTMILLASVFLVVREECGERSYARWLTPVLSGYWFANVSLLVFWIALIAAGVGKALYAGPSFQHMMQSIHPYLLAFVVAGVGLTVGLWMVAVPAMRLIGAVVVGAQRPQDADQMSNAMGLDSATSMSSTTLPSGSRP
jgi:nitric oxide reductase subunit B